MSTKDSSTFSLVRKISEFLKLGDDGKLGSFFTRVIKTLEKEVTAFNQNLKNLKFNHDAKLDELKDSLEDAQTALAESYMKVDIDQIGTNENQKEFMTIYLENIDSHELAVQEIEKKIEAEKEKYEKSVKDTQAEIDSRQKRIDEISKTDTESVK